MYDSLAGRITDIDQMEQIFTHLMDDVMQMTLDDRRVIVTEPPNNDPKLREQLVELL